MAVGHAGTEVVDADALADQFRRLLGATGPTVTPRRRSSAAQHECVVYFAVAAAACSMRSAAIDGWEIITTWEAPFTTIVFFALARCAMKACTAGGMTLSALP
jgi:hypothetical protein